MAWFQADLKGLVEETGTTSAPAAAGTGFTSISP